MFCRAHQIMRARNSDRFGVSSTCGCVTVRPFRSVQVFEASYISMSHYSLTKLIYAMQTYKLTDLILRPEVKSQGQTTRG